MLCVGALVAACGSSSEPKPRATQLAISRQPQTSVSSGAVLSPQPVVEIHDAAGVLVPSSQAVVTAVLSSGSGTLTGKTAVAAVNGVATFTDLAISGPGGSYTIQFSSPGLTSVSATPVTITAPSIALDSAALVDSTVVGSNAAPRLLSIINTGNAPLTGVTVDRIVYDGNPPSP